MKKCAQRMALIINNAVRLSVPIAWALILAFATQLLPLNAEASTNGPVIDLMVVYTPAAKTNAGGDSAMNALVDAAVAEANTVMSESQAAASFRLVYRGEVAAYTEVGDATNDLENLRLGVNGAAGVATLRTTYGADLVCMITEAMPTNMSGRSYLMDQYIISPDFSDYAFSVVKRSALTNGTYAMMRWLGRNLGCQTDHANALDSDGNLVQGAYDYAFGYTFVGVDTNAYRTVMGGGTNPCCGLLSNPNLVYDGVAVGTATNNNALCISNTAPVVAGFFTSEILFQFSSNSMTLPEDAGTVTVHVQRSGPTDAKNVRVVFVPQTADTNDYVAQSTTLTFASGETSKTVSFSVVNDNLIEPNETFQIVLTNNSSGTLLGPNSAMTVTLQESKAGLAWSNTAVSALEPSASGTNLATLTVQRTGNTNMTNTISWATVDGTATAGINYRAANGTLTLLPGVQTTNVLVQVLNDGLSPGTLQFTVAMSGANAGTFLLNTNATVSVLDSDVVFQFATNALSVSEANTNANLIVLRVGATNTSMTVNLVATDETATNGVRYQVVSLTQTVTFAAGDVSKVVPVPLINDWIVNGDQTFSAMLSNASTGTVGTVSNCVVTVLDDDVLIGWTVTSQTMLENAAATNFAVYRLGVTTATNLVTYTFPTGTITNDFIGRSGTLTFLPSQTSKTVSFQPRANTTIQTNRTVVVQLGVTAVAGVPTLVNTNLVITLLESKSAVAWSSTNAVIAKPDQGVTTNLILTLERTGNTNQTTQVSFTTVDGTAISNAFTGASLTTTNAYTRISDLATFAPGDMIATVRVSLVGNGLPLGDLQFSATLTTNNTLVVSSNLVVNSTFDTGIDSWTVAGGDGNNDWITNGGNPGGAYSNGSVSAVFYSDFYQDLTTVSGRTYTISFDVLNTPDPIYGDYLEVFFGDNSLVNTPDTEGLFEPRSYTAVATGAVTRLNFSGWGNPDTPGWLIDNVVVQDSPLVVVTDPVTLLLNTNVAVTIQDPIVVYYFATNAVSASETNGNAGVKLTVWCLGNTNITNTVNYAAEDGTAVSGVRYKPTSGTLSFSPGVFTQTVTVQLINNGLVTGDQTFFVKLTAPNPGALGTVSNCAVTVLDKDIAIGWVSTNVTLLESAPVTNLWVYRRGLTTGTNLVGYTFPTGPIADDFIASSGTLTFLPGVTNLSVAFQPQLNDVIQTNRAVVVSLTLSNVVAGVPSLGNSNLVITLIESKSGVAWSPTSQVVDEPAAGLTTNVMLTLVRSGNTNQTTHVIVGTEDGSAISNLFTLTTLTTTNNYTATNGTVTFDPGVTNVNAWVALVGNGVAQGTRQFNVRLRPAVTNNILANGTFETGIGSPWVNVNGGVWETSYKAYANINGVGNNADFYQDLTTVSGRTYTVTFDLMNESIDSSFAVWFGGASLSISDPSTIGFENFSLPVVATSTVTRINFRGCGGTTDGWYLDNVQVLDSVLIPGTDPLTVLLNTNDTLTILDYDRTYQFATNALSVSETNGSVTLTVLRIGKVTDATSVPFYTEDLAPEVPARFTPTNATVSFSIGVITQTVRVGIVNDVLVNGNHTFQGCLSNYSSRCDVTILDDEVELGWVLPSATMYENAAQTNLAVYRTGGVSGTTLVNYFFPTGSITNDFIARSGTLTFQPGDTSKFVAFQPRLNSVIQTNRAVIVQLGLTNVVAGIPALGINSNMVITLVESKAGVGWSVTNSVVTEPARGLTNNATLTLVRTGNTNQTTQVNFATLNGSALSNLFTLATLTTTNNYTATNGAVTFAPGITNLDVQVQLVGNGVSQGDKLFNVLLDTLTYTVYSNNVVANGDFEAGTNAWTFVNTDTNSLIVTATGNPAGAYFNGNTNLVSADLYQDLVTTSNHTYSITFDVKMVQPTNSALLNVLFGDTTILAAPVATNTYTNYVYTQTATSATTRINFRGYGNTNGWFIDNVQVRDTTPFIGNDDTTVLLNTTDAVTVQDYDVVFQFATNVVSVSETNLSITLTVQRLYSTNGISSVGYSTTELTASNGVRYLSTNGTLTFPAGVVTQGVTVTLIDDTRVNFSQNFQVNLGILSVGSLGAASNCVVTVLDNDVEFGWGATNLTLLENAGVNNLQVYRRGATNATNVVSYLFPSGPIANDFITSGTTLTFLPGDASQLVPFQTQPNNVIQADRTINVRLGLVNPVAGVMYLANTNLVITLQESKSAVAWTPDNVLHTKPAAGATNVVTLTLIRTGNTNQTTQVSFATADGTAIANVFSGSTLTGTNGYTTTNGVVTFLPGATNLAVSVEVVGNGLVEAIKLFTVVLSTNNTLVASPTNNLVANGTFDTSTTSWTLNGNDGNCGCNTNIGNPSGAFSNANAGSISAELFQNLTTISGHTYTISFAIQNESASSDSAVVSFGDTTLLTTPLTVGFSNCVYTQVATGSVTKLSFAGYDNSDYWAIDNVQVLDASGVVIADPDTLLLNTNATVTLQDNTVSFQFANTNLIVSETNGSVALIVQRIGNTDSAVGVNLQTAAIDAADGVRYIGTNMTVQLGVGIISQIVNVAILDNALVDGDRRFSALLSVISTGIVATASNAVVTIQDNDIAVGWLQTSMRILENAGLTNLVLYRSGVTGGTSVVSYNFLASSSVSNDFNAQSGTLTFGANEIRKNVAFTPVENSLIQTDRTITVSLSLTNGPYGVPYLANTNLVITLAESKSGVAWRQTNLTWNEAPAGTTNWMLLSLARTGNTNQTTQVSFATVDGTAIRNIVTGTTITQTNNYTGTNGLVTFAPGITNASVLVSGVGNGRAEGALLFSVTLSANSMADSITNNVVINGTFNTDTNSWLLSPADANCGWSTNVGNAAGSYTNANQGSVVADFYQDLVTKPGHSYTVSFDLENEATNGSSAQVFFGDALLLDTTQTTGFQSFPFTQVATSAVTRIRFSGYGNTGAWWAVDNVVVRDVSAFRVEDPVIVLLNTNVSVTLLDNDVIFRFASTNASLSEASGTVSMTVLRDGDTNSSMTVGFATVNGSASNGVRFLGTTNTLTFAAGVTSQVAQVTLINDTLVNGDQTFRVRLATPSAGLIGTASNCNVTVIDDDVELGWRTTTLSLLSNAGTTNLVVYRLGITNGTNYVNYTFPSGDITNYFFATNGTLTFLPGETNQNVAFQALSNNLIQADQTVTVQLALTNDDPAVTYLANTNLVITLQEFKGGLAWELTDVTEMVPALGHTNTLTLNVQRTGNINQTNVVTWSTIAGTATNVGNFTAASGTLTFLPGVSLATVSVNILNDGQGQQACAFSVALANPDTSALLLNTNVNVTILSANSLFQFTAGTASVSETNGTVTLYVQRIGKTDQLGTVDFATANGTATNGVRYTATTGTLSFAAGVVSQALTVPLINNVRVDGNQTFLVSLSNASSIDGVGTGSNCTVTVQDDDVEIRWAVTALSLLENAGTNQLVVYRSGVTNNTDLVNYRFPTTGAITDDFVAANGTLTFLPGVTNLSVAFAPVLNNVLQTNRAVVATLALPSVVAGVPYLGNTNMVITLVESKAGLAWSSTSLTVAEPTPSTNVTLTVLRSGNTNQTSTVAWTTVDGDATAGTNYLAAGGTLTLLPGVTSTLVSILVTNDNQATGNRQFSVALTNLDDTAAVLLNTNAIVTISDGSTMFQFASANVSVLETNRFVTLTVLRIGASDALMTVGFTNVNGTATNGLRYTATNGTLRFAVGVTSTTLRVTLTNNVRVDGDQTFQIQLINASTGTVGSACTVTVLDNDVAFGWAFTNLALLEDAAPTNLVVYRIGATANSNTVRYSFPTGSITNDFIARSGTLTFDPGVTNMYVSFQPRTNNVIQTNRAVKVTLAVTPVAGVPYLVNSNLVITLQEYKAGLAWSPSSVSVVEPVTGTTNATLTLLRSYNTNVTSTVFWTTVDGTASNESSYFAASGTLTLDPGVVSTNISIVITNDNVVRETVQFKVAMSNLETAASGLVNSNATVYILAGQSSCQFTTNAVSVSETNRTVALTVRRTSTNSTFSVNFRTANDTATTNRYVATNGTLNFALGVATGVVRVALINDNMVDTTNITFIVALSNALVNGSIPGEIGSYSNCVVSLLDNNVVIGWAMTNLTMLENADPTNLVVYRLGITTLTNLVTYRFPTTGTITNDFIARGGTLTFKPGMTNLTVAFQPRLTNTIQTNRIVRGTLSVTAVRGTLLPYLASSNLAITLVDPRGGLGWVTNAVSAQGLSDSRTNTVPLWIKRIGNSDQTNSVAWATADGTATAGTDYNAANGTLTFNPGELSNSVPIEILGYDLPKDPRAFTVTLSNPDENAAVLVTNVTVSVVASDAMFQFASTNVSILETNRYVTLVVRRGGATNTSVAVRFVSVDGSAVAPTRYVSTNGLLTFRAGVVTNIIRVALTNNVRVDGNQYFNVNLAIAGSTGILGTASNAIVTVVDDDMEIGWAVTNLALLENAGTNLLTIYRTGVTNGTAAVRYTFPTGTITNDFQARSGTLTFRAGETNRTVTFLPLPNRVIQTNRNLKVTLSLPTVVNRVPYLGANRSNLVITLMESKSAVAWAMTNTAWSSSNRTVAATNTVFMEPAAGVTNWALLRLVRSGNTNQSAQVSFATTNGTAFSNLVFGTLITNVVILSATTNVDESGYTNIIVDSSTTNVVPGTLSITNNYIGTNGMVTFDPGVTNIDVQVGLVGNGVAQDWIRRFVVRLTTNSTLVASTTNNVVTNGTFDVGLDGWALSQDASDSLGFVAVGGNPGGAFINGVPSPAPADLYQDLITIPGHNYVISFDLWHGTADAIPQDDGYSLDVSFGGSNVFSSSDTSILPGVYTSCTVTQVAVGITNRLNFHGADDLGYFYLDNVRVQDATVVIVADPVVVLLNTNATVGIRDRDSAIQFATNLVSVSETNGFVRLVVQRAGETNLTSSVGYVTSDGSATNGVRYWSTNGTLRFLPGMLVRTAQVALINNTLVDGDQWFNVTLTNATGVGAFSNCTVTIQNNDTRIGWAVTNLSILENAGLTNLVVYRNGFTNGTNVISYTFLPATGAITNDYIGRSGSLTFKPGVTSTNVAFTPRMNNVIQTNRNITVRLASVSQLGKMTTYMENTNLVIRLMESKAGMAWVTNAVSTAEPAAGLTNSATLTVRCTGNINQTNLVAWVTHDGTGPGAALDGVNYVASSGTLTFAPGQQTSDVTIPVLGDGASAGMRRFTVSLTNLDQTVSVLLNTNATVSIQDYDTTFQFTNSTVSVSETNAAVLLTVRRAGSTNVAMTVDYATVDGSAISGVRYTTTNGTLMFAAGVLTQTVRVALINTRVVDGDQTFTVALNNASAGTVGATSNCTVTVIDNDVSIGWSLPSLTLYDNTGSNNLLVVRSGVTNGTNAVTFTFPTTGAITNDFRARSGTLTFRPGETNKWVDFQTLPNNVIQTNRLLTARLAAVATPVTGVPYLTISNLVITLLESKSGVSWSQTNSAVAEAAPGVTNWLTLALTRRGNTNQTTQVSFATITNTAQPDAIDGSVTNNYTGTNGLVTFDPGVTNASVMVAMVGNGRADDGSVKFNVELTASSLVASSNLVANGTFDTGTDSWTCVNGDANGWNATSGNPGGAYQNASTNSSIVDFYQDLATVSGLTYTVSFDVMNTTLDDDLEVVFGETTLLSTLATPLDTVGAFQSLTYQAVATNDTTRLNFSGYGNSTIWTIDNVVVMDAAHVVVVDPVTILLNTNSQVTITNTDVAFTFMTNAVSVNETNSTVKLWVRRNGATNTLNTVDYATVNGTALDGVRYGGQSDTLTFNPGVRSQAVTIALINTPVVDWNQTFNVVLSAPSFGTLGTSTSTVTVVDRSISIGWAQASLVVPGNDFRTNLLTVTRYGNNLNFTNKVNYTFPTGAITNNFIARSGTLTFLPGTGPTATNQTLTVAFAQKANPLVLTDVVVNVSLAFVSGFTGVAYLDPAGMAITLSKTMATLSWTTNAVSTAEPAVGLMSDVTLTVQRGGITTGTTIVAWATADGSAAAGDNYVTTNGTLTFGPEELSKDVTVQVIGDGLATGSKQFAVNLTNPDTTNATLLTSSVTVTILDSDAGFLFTAGAMSVSETNSTATLKVVRVGATDASMSVDYATRDGSATDGARYTAKQGTLNFGPGVVTQTVSVAIINNTALDGNQSFYVDLSNPVGAVLGTPSNCTVTVSDDDVRIDWAVTNVVTMLDNAAQTNLVVYRVGATSSNTSYVTYTFPGQSGTNDYLNAQSGTLTFLPGVTSNNVSFQPRINNLILTNHDIVVRLSPTAGKPVVQLGTSNLVIHLLKSQGGVAFTPTSVAEPVGPTANASVVLTRSGNTDLTNIVNWTTSNGSAMSNVNYIAASGTLTLLPGVTETNVSITLLDDKVASTNKAFYVVLSTNATSPSPTVLLQTNALVTIINSDATIQFSIASNRVVESSNAVLTVARSGPTNSTVWVSYTTTNGSGVAGTDYVATNGTLTFDPGVVSCTMTVEVLNDSVMASNRTFMVLLTDTSFGAALGSRTTNTVTILDDDCLFWMAITNTTITKTVGTVPVTVFRRGYTNAAASVYFTTQDGTATQGVRYLTTTGTLTMAAGVTNATIQVGVINDSITWPSMQYFQVVLSNPSTNAALSNAVETIYIRTVSANALPSPKSQSLPQTSGVSGQVISSAAPTTQTSGTLVGGSATVPAGGEVQTIDIAGEAAVTVRLDGVEIPVGLPDGAEFMTVTVRGGVLVLDVTALAATGKPVLWSGELSVLGADADADGVPDRLAAGPLADGTVVLRVQFVDGTLLAETQLPGKLMVVPAAVTFGQWPVEWRLKPTP